jgi:ATP-binding cassette subfamily F protein uup
VDAPAGISLPPSRKGLSFKEKTELDALPARIEALEAEQRTINAELADGLLFARHPQRGAELTARHAQIEDELMNALERWETLSR